MGTCAVLGMSNQDALSEDPFLNHTLQSFTCELYHGFGSFIAPLSIGIITRGHYLSERNIKMIENRDSELQTKVDRELVEHNAMLAKFNPSWPRDWLSIMETSWL